MIIQLKKQPSNRGSALVITMVIGVILLLTLSSYLMLVGTQKKLVTRSECWNASLTMAEAGAEEALAQMNGSPGDFSANAWGVSGVVYGPMARNLEGGSYSVIISNTVKPVIYTTGIVKEPVTGDSIARRVKINTTRQGLINVAMGAKHDVTFVGSGMATDSWNSHDPNLSTGGLFDPAKTSTNGDVASLEGLVDISNHSINGSLYLGPTATYTSPSNQVTGKIYRDSNIEFPDVNLPAVSWVIAPLNLGIHTFTTSGNFTISDRSPIVVNAGVIVALNVTTGGNYNPSSVQIHGGTTNSGTANIYLNGPNNATINGNTAADASNRPENFYYYGLGSLNNITMGGGTSFAGVIYAPGAKLILNGGGSGNNLIGAVIVDSVQMNGHYNFHYDESLATNGPARFVATSWQEL